MKKIFTFIFGMILVLSLQSCMGAYAVSSYDNVYSDYDDYIASDINIVITHGTPYYYDGYLNYYFYNGWYYYPYFYNNYWYFRPYRHAFRPGYIPRIHYRSSDLYLRSYRHGFSRPYTGHRGLPRVSDRRFGENRHTSDIHRNNNRVYQNRDINRGRTVHPSTRSTTPRQGNINTRPIPNRSSVGRPSSSGSSSRSGRFGGRR